MAHRNRVGPFGDIAAESYRGTWMGNRGGPSDTDRRRWASKTWIYCHLEFKSRDRVFRDPSRKYTELFFYDEAVALAAGHRPCGECQHARLLEYKACVGHDRAGEIDDVLHRQRSGERETATIGSLPAGSFVDHDGPTLILRDGALRWSAEAGYTQFERPLPGVVVPVLTPALTRTALARGFAVTLRE